MIHLSQTDHGVTIPVYVTPGSSTEKLSGERDGALKAYVNASPEKGKANKAVLKLLAKTFGVPKSSVRLVAGEKSRSKSVLIQGARRKEIEECLRKTTSPK